MKKHRHTRLHVVLYREIIAAIAFLIITIYPQNISDIRWVALGDSITEGYYSKEDGTYSKAPDYSWTRHVADITGMELDNRAVGGVGFVDTVSQETPVNARTIADEIDFSNYDLATVFFGVNDWKGYHRLGSFDDDIEKGGTVYSNMRYVIEKILNDNPLCEIIVISPLNCSAYGSYNSNWGIGHKFNSTKVCLADIYEAEKDICEYYNIHMIDVTYDSFITKDNIQTYLFDKVHPSVECHKKLGKVLAERIKDCLN